MMSSAAGIATLPLACAYHASKWGLEGLAGVLRKEVAGFGIRVSVINPGMVKTCIRSTKRQVAFVWTCMHTHLHVHAHTQALTLTSAYACTPLNMGAAAIPLLRLDSPEKGVSVSGYLFFFTSVYALRCVCIHLS